MITSDINRLKEIVTYLEGRPEIKYTPYPEYDSKIYELLSSLGTDDEYMSNYDVISKKDINEMSLADLKTIYTFILRGERFCDGHIASFIDDETILKLAKRELQLLK